MRAAVHTRYGPPDVVQVTEVAQPVPRDDELLIRVHATTVNRTDAATRSATPFFARLITGLVRPKATILGNEFAGEVVAVGGGVRSFEVGNRVFGYVEGRFGAHAEYLTVAEDASVAQMPAGWTFDEVAAATEGSHYALAFLEKGHVEAGQSVLVNGATGAIGSAAVQLAKNVGARVTATCATEHVDLVAGLGAERVIDYTVQDFTQDEQCYDAVLDTVGKSSFRRCRRLLRPNGVYLSSELGFLWQNPLLALVSPLFRGKKVVFPMPRHDQEMMESFKALMESGAFKPLVDRTYPLDQIVGAYRYVETGEKIGNVVISVGDEGDPTR